MQKFVFFLSRKDSGWDEEEEEKTYFCHCNQNPRSRPQKSKAENFYGRSRWVEREGEREQPSVRNWGGCEALVECFKAQRFLLRANVSNDTRPAVHTNTHLVECKRTMRFSSRRCCSRFKAPTDTDASQIVAVVSTGDTRRLRTFRTCCLNGLTQFVAYVVCVTTIIVENGPSQSQT